MTVPTDRLEVIREIARENACLVAAIIDTAPPHEVTLSTLAGHVEKFLSTYPEIVVAYVARVRRLPEHSVRAWSIIKRMLAFQDEAYRVMAEHDFDVIYQAVMSELAPYRLPISGPLNS